MLRFIKELIDVAHLDIYFEEERAASRKILQKFINWENDDLDKSTTSISNQKNYPWPIIISMGVVIVSLIGVIVFLLIKKSKTSKINNNP